MLPRLAAEVAEDRLSSALVQDLYPMVQSRAESGAASGPSMSKRSDSPMLRVLCRTPGQVSAACRLTWLPEIVLDFLEVQGLKEAVQEVQRAGKRAVVATPRVLKPDEQRLLAFYLRVGADALLVRSTGLLHQLLGLGGSGAPVPAELVPGGSARVPQLEGDFSLNAANAVSADLLLSCGLDRLTPTHDLNAVQLCELAEGLGSRGGRLEAVLHQHLPVFHTEYCAFCRFLSTGSNYKDCGHPCESTTLHLRDGEGKDHLVLADMGCRNTVFSAVAQSGLRHWRELLAAGYRAFRVELVDEPADVVAPLMEAYRDVLEGRRGWREVWSFLGTLPDANGRKHGVNEGSLAVIGEQAKEARKETAYQKKTAGLA